ncbi:hypothetical protein MTP99_003774 [Tenebrio molitor]|jgi:YEATS domain-containing protein 1/3|nr:hypothetical protein MTP99_003774 [Tenebrio molitor]
MAVRIYLEIGHEASIRTKKTQEGFTHDWEVFVRGCDGAEIHYYVEKVVFYLHETFPKPKRVVKEPPYSVKESGYAGFNLPIDIYLRNNNEPKKIRFNYDLHLQPVGPTIVKTQKEKYTFNSLTDDFKIKLLKGGGMIWSSSSIQDVNDSRTSLDDKNQMTNKPKLAGCDVIKKQKIKLGEPCRDFQELFGSPINMSSKSSEQKLQIPKQETKGVEKSRTKHSPHKDSHKDKEKSKDKTDSEKKNKDEKKQKDKSRDRERSKDKTIKKEKSPRPKSPSPKRSPKRSVSPRFSGPPVMKHKESKQHDKEKRDKSGDKPKKEKRSKEHKENKHGEEQKPLVSEEHKDSKVRIESKKDVNKVKMESSVSPPPKIVEKKEKSSKEKSSKEPSKDDKYSEKYKHKKRDKEKREKKEEKPYKSEKKVEKVQTEPKPNLFKMEPQVKKEKMYVNPVIPAIDDDSSNSSTSSSSLSLVERQPEKKSKSEVIKTKEEKNQKLKKEKGYQDNTIKCKRKSSSVDPEEPTEKVHKAQGINNNSDGEQEAQGKTTVLPTAQEEEEDYFGLLRDLQHKIMGLKDNSDLQKVVKLIAETGRYEVSAHTFDFDLCLLDRSTVQQLQEFFASET